MMRIRRFSLLAVSATAAFAAVLLSVPLPLSAASNVTYDFSADNKHYDCTSPSSATIYHVQGESSAHHLSIKGGSSSDPIEVHLDNLNLNGSGGSSPVIDIADGSYVKLVVDGAVDLKGGSHHGFLENAYGYAALRTAGSHVTITGTGKLTAKGGADDGDSDGGAGIGGNYEEGAGNLTFDGPTIVSMGGGEAAGIGTGCMWGNGGDTNITIKSGDITANGGRKGAGIGQGNRPYSKMGKISIAGGKVTATGGENGAGIGSGAAINSNKQGTISISGGVVTATGTGSDAAGIGASDATSFDKIEITGNVTVTAEATGENGAGIGAAWAGDVGEIVIKPSAGSVTATAVDDGAGIGAADGYPDNGADANKITVEPSGTATVTATGGDEGAGIGGATGAKTGSVTVIAHDSATVTATGGKKAAGIGGANGDGADSVTVGTTGEGAVVTATGGEDGAGIGGGDGSSKSITISMSGGSIKAYGGKNGAGIGGGDDDGGKISISGSGSVYAQGGTGACGIGGGKDGDVDSITIKGNETASDPVLSIDARAGDENGGGTLNDGAGIGSGKGTGGSIEIDRATVDATADAWGADIGGGDNNGLDVGTFKSITVSNSTVNTHGDHKMTPGIGSGYGSRVDDISLSNTTYDGNSIGSSVSANRKFLQMGNPAGNIKSITISNGCDITADWDNVELGEDFEDENAAGIGTGTFGCIESIHISDSTVVAKGINGGAGIGSGSRKLAGASGKADLGEQIAEELYEIVTCSNGSHVDDITIERSTVTAYAGHGLSGTSYQGAAAGIGAGLLGQVDNITIKESTVEAYASTNKTGDYGGAGIGGASCSDTEKITISNSDVTAEGGAHCAGVGGSGMENPGNLNELIHNPHLDYVVINDGSTVTATGGVGAAGIGTGQGTRFGDKTPDGYNIKISDSAVTATGGKHGAGIGSGDNGTWGYGADAGPMLFSGACVITATGGEGAAGVGAGMDGRTYDIDINLMTAGEKGDQYYLKATAGSGAAGIGSGGVIYGEHDLAIPIGHKTGDITISGGYVEAHGGGQLGCDHPGVSTVGAGAGIGGGAAKGTLGTLTVTGGIVKASAGWQSDGGKRPLDIGHGGDQKLMYDGDRSWADDDVTITGGTVLANSITNEDDVTIDGGSISANILDSASTSRDNQPKNSKGQAVYRTTMTLADEANTEVKLTPSYEYYGTKDIYSDDNRKIYVYYPADGENAAKATVNVKDDSRDYWGTTADNGNGVMKMGGTVAFKPLANGIAKGDDAVLEVDDSNLKDTGWSFTSTGAVDVVQTVQGDSPGAKVKVHANDTGACTVTGTSTSAGDDEVYWNHTAVFEDTLVSEHGAIAFTESASKVYDSQPALTPGVTSNSDGAVTYQFTGVSSTGERYEAATPPTAAGVYKVTATLAETSHYTQSKAEQNFQIFKAEPKVELSATKPSASNIATVTATIAGLYDADKITVDGREIYGTVKFVRDSSTTMQTAEVVKDDKGNFVASIDLAGVAEGEYRIDAEFNNESGNYEKATATKTFSPKKAERKVDGMDGMSTNYGAGGMDLHLTTTGTPSDSSADVWTTEVIWDSYGQYGLPGSVQIASGSEHRATGASINFAHAGKTKLKVSVHDTSGQYEDAFKLCEITVNPVYLDVTSYAYEAGKPDAAIDRATYGSLDGIEYGLKCSGFVGDDTADTFTHGHGTLSAVGPTATAGAGTQQISILQNGAPLRVGNVDYGDKFFSRDYMLQIHEGALTVDKRSIIITVNDATGTYGGAEPTYSYSYNPADQDSALGLAPFDTVQQVFTEEPNFKVSTLDPTPFDQLNAGTYPIVASDGKSDNYCVVEYSGVHPTDAVTYKDGTLTVNPEQLDDASRIQIETMADLLYNGQQQLPTIVGSDRTVPLDPSKDYTVSLHVPTLLGTETQDSLDTGWEPERPRTRGTDAGVAVVMVTGTGNYTGSVYRSYRINPVSLTVNTGSATKLFDGTPLTCDEGSIEGASSPVNGFMRLFLGSASGLVNGETATLNMTGKQTVPGSSPNSYEIDWGDTNPNNYSTADQLGELTVNSNNISYGAVTTPDDVVYNGLVQKQPVTVTGPSGETLVEGVDYDITYGDTLNVGTASVSVTGRGAYRGELSTSYEIKPAKLHIVTNDASKEYDGTPLTAEGSIEGIVNNESVSFETTGTITDAGSVPNAYSLTWDGTAKEANYEIDSEHIGTLTVLPTGENQQVLSVAGYTGTYDAQEHGIQAIASLAGSKIEYSVDGGSTWSDVTPTFTDAGASTVFVRASNPNYEQGAAVQQIEVVISPAELVVTTDSASKLYDGEPLTADGVIDGFVGDETAAFAVTGSQTEVGSSVNTYEISWDGTAKQSNYKVTEHLGTLTVTSEEAPAAPGGSGFLPRTFDEGLRLFGPIALIALAGFAAFALIRRKAAK